jgi:hypothetical protein
MLDCIGLELCQTALLVVLAVLFAQLALAQETYKVEGQRAGIYFYRDIAEVLF